ncbi:hypothetical protein FRC17_006960 [Serendipita sp. 399]|nr:hypothetical protein FRC17_006960 [Serendipita sp. 399]
MDVDSAVLVFPPGSMGPSSESRVATAFVAGPSAMACPEGKRTIYLSTEIEPEASPEETLQPYLSAIQCLNRNTEETSRVYSSLFYTQWLPHSGTPDDGDEIEGIISLRQPSSHIAESGDETAQEAARVFWETIGRLGLDGRGRAREEKSDLSTEPSSSEETEQDDFVTIMWPPLTNDETEAVDD